MKISGILPTRGRQEWAAQAVACFLSQTYPDKELIVIDDDDDPSFPSGVDCPSITYTLLRRPVRMLIPEKRQLCCTMTQGQLIAHFDSDDYSDPHRLETQVAQLHDSGKCVAGFHTLMFWDTIQCKAFQYNGWANYALGTSLLYTREFWETHGWQPTRNGIASDNHFVREARDRDQLFTADGSTLMVARTHTGNTSPKAMYSDPFKEVSASILPAGFPR